MPSATVPGQYPTIGASLDPPYVLLDTTFKIRLGLLTNIHGLVDFSMVFFTYNASGKVRSAKCLIVIDGSVGSYIVCNTTIGLVWYGEHLAIPVKAWSCGGHE
jgi:hypothetical protein